jgi:hypothetical protein
MFSMPDGFVSWPGDYIANCENFKYEGRLIPGMIREFFKCQDKSRRIQHYSYICIRLCFNYSSNHPTRLLTLAGQNSES